MKMRVSTAIGATLTLCTATLAWDITFYENEHCGNGAGNYV
jgi:hypothetical protein